MKKKCDNSNMRAKIACRVLAVRELGEPARVLDLYHGRGHVWRRVSEYLRVDELCGVDIEPRDIATLRLSAMRAIKNLPIERFNVFDLDPYGSCFGEYSALCDRLSGGPPRRVVVAMTMAFRCAGACVPKSLWDALGVPVEHRPNLSPFSAEDLFRLAILLFAHTWRPERIWSYHDSRRLYISGVGSTNAMRPMEAATNADDL